MKKFLIVAIAVACIAGVWQTITSIYDWMFMCYSEATTAPLGHNVVRFGEHLSTCHYGFIDHAGKLVIPAKFEDSSATTNESSAQ